MAGKDDWVAVAAVAGLSVAFVGLVVALRMRTVIRDVGAEGLEGTGFNILFQKMKDA